MGLLLRRLLLLGAAAFLLEGPCGESSSHSLLYFRTYISEPVPGLPQYTEVGYLDGQPIEHYNSIAKKMQPSAPWMNQSVGVMENYWDVQSTLGNLNEEGFEHFVLMLERYYGGYEGDSIGNSSCFASEFPCEDGSCIPFGYICDLSQDCKDGSDEKPSLCDVKGFHTLQCIDGCELSDDGKEKLYHREAYDGKEMDEWEGVWDVYRHRKNFLGLTCFGWLQRHLESRKETVTKTDPPEVQVIHKPVNGSLETLVCKIGGFFPKDINAVWLKDGEVVEDEQLRVNVFPNADGTYQAQLSIQVNRREGSHYECHVDLTALEEPVHMGSRWSGSVWPIVGSVLGAVAVGVLLVAGIIFYIHKPNVRPSEHPMN